MKAILAAAILLCAVACGQSQGHQAESSPSAPASPQPLLFAVLQAKGTPNAWTYNTVVIAGLDGRERATATFAPMPLPNVGCMGAILQPPAHVAAGKVFFADANGVIRSLAIDGAVTEVTAFPMTSSQQMLSFAVSPDGTRLLGTVFTVPTNAWTCDGSTSSATFGFDAYAATNGGSSRLVYHQSWTKPQDVLALTGWDAAGPIGTFPTIWASQGGGPGSTLGVKVRVDATTVKPGALLSDPSKCLAWDSNQSGSFVCTEDSVMTNGGTPQQQVAVPVSVRGASGTEIWHFTATGENGPFNPVLSPDGQRVLMCCTGTAVSELVFSSDGTSSTLGAGFLAGAWLDSQTAIGELHSDPLQQPPLTLGYVSLGASASVVSLGFTGLFVGTVRA
jgi:hypothetical protein